MDLLLQSTRQLGKIKQVTHPFFKTKTIEATFPAGDKGGALEKAIDRIEERITHLKEVYSKSKKDITEQINAYKARIATFEGK
mgnify:CR=1 FL=1